jgi:hypothetical protein
MSQVATREVRAFSSSSAKVTLASLDYWRDCLAACLADLSSAREISASNRTDFSSDIVFYTAFKSLANTANQEGHKSAKEIERKK